MSTMLTIKNESLKRAFSGWKESLKKMFPDTKIVGSGQRGDWLIVDVNSKDFPLLYESFRRICRIEYIRNDCTQREKRTM